MGTNRLSLIKVSQREANEEAAGSASLSFGTGLPPVQVLMRLQEPPCGCVVVGNCELKLSFGVAEKKAISLTEVFAVNQYSGAASDYDQLPLSFVAL